MVFNRPMNSHQKLRAAFLKSAMEVVDETKRTLGYTTPKPEYSNIPGLPEWLTNTDRVNPAKPEESVSDTGDNIWTGRTVTGTGKGPPIGAEKGSDFK